jgi:hypothetical protein
VGNIRTDRCAVIHRCVPVTQGGEARLEDAYAVVVCDNVSRGIGLCVVVISFLVTSFATVFSVIVLSVIVSRSCLLPRHFGIAVVTDSVSVFVVIISFVAAFLIRLFRVVSRFYSF